MTAINAASSAVYLKGFTIREKVQTYSLAVIFLILLYNSPSGLVLYWTLNNLFSLAKNAVRRRNSERGKTAGQYVHSARDFIYRVLDTVMARRGIRTAWGWFSALFVSFALYLVFSGMARFGRVGKWRLLAAVCAIVWAALPSQRMAWRGDRLAVIWHTVCALSLTAFMLFMSVCRVITYGNPGVFRTTLSAASIVWLVSAPLLRFCLTYRNMPLLRAANSAAGRNTLFLVSAASLALLLGWVLPSSVIATSPAEFSFIGDVDNPLCYVSRTLCVFAGLCILYPAVLYKMSSARVQTVMAYTASFLLMIACLNVYVFGFNYGTMDNFLSLSDKSRLSNYSPFYMIVPIAATAVCAALLLAAKQFGFMKYVSILMLGACVSEFALGAVKAHKVYAGYTECAAHLKTSDAASTFELPKVYHLSKTGKNVVVLFLDRAVSSFFPYIMHQFPQLAQQFDGFVYYPNTVSFSYGTVKCTPAMMGGYEYTPENENKRPDELLVDKHNEAMLLAPRLFSEAGWEVTVTDPPFCNYAWGFWDAAPFDAYPDIKYHYEQYRYTEHYLQVMSAKGELNASDNIALSSAITASHIAAFSIVRAVYPVLRKSLYDKGRYFQCQHQSGLPLEYKCDCLNDYALMYYLADVTDCDAQKNTYIFIGSNLTHQPNVLKEPEYEPADNVDESKATCGYYEWKVPFDGGEGDLSDLAHYHVNAAAMLQTAKWLDKLREMGVYDNTRIIIVADHGVSIPTPVDYAAGKESPYICATYNPLLLMKDFDSHGQVRTDNTFMTNADTILLAKQGLTISGINPFTGRSIDEQVDKAEVRIYPVVSEKEFNEGDPHTLKNTKTWVLNDKSRDFGGLHPQAVHDNIFDERNWRQLE